MARTASTSSVHAQINRCGVFPWNVPGIKPPVTTFIAYDIEKRLSKHPNALVAVSWKASPTRGTPTMHVQVVVLSADGLRIPSCPPLAVLLGAFMMYVFTGPSCFNKRPDVAWGLNSEYDIGKSCSSY